MDALTWLPKLETALAELIQAKPMNEAQDKIIRSSIRLQETLDAVTKATLQFGQASEWLVSIAPPNPPPDIGLPPQNSNKIQSEAIRGLRRALDEIAVTCQLASVACGEFDAALQPACIAATLPQTSTH